MKWLRYFSCVLAGTVMLSVYSTHVEATEKIPTPLLEVAAAYKSKGSGGFLPALVKGSPLQYTDKAALAQAGDLFKSIEIAYGEFLGLDMVGVVRISTSIRIVYFVLNYERGPLYGVADLYKTKSGEIVTNSNVHTNLEVIMSPDLITRLH